MSKKSKAQRAERWQRRKALTEVTRVPVRVGEDCKTCGGPHKGNDNSTPHFRTTGVQQRFDDPKTVRDELSRIDDEVESVRALLFGFDREITRLKEEYERIPQKIKDLTTRQTRGLARVEGLLARREKTLLLLEGARRQQEVEALTSKLLEKKKVLSSLLDGTAPVPPTVVVRAERHVDSVSVGDTQYLPPSGEKAEVKTGGVVLKSPTKRR